MSKLTDYELLRLIYKHLSMSRLLAEHPAVTKADVDSLFQRLSHQIRTSTTPTERFILLTDGASRGNPGPAGIGVVILNSDNQVLEEIAESIGECTNNEAEYQALARGIRRAQELGARELLIKSDSELIVKQLNGVYRVKSRNLLPLCREVMTLLRGFAKWQAAHISREENARADMLANLGVKQDKGWR
jgi:ribonuclease HI